MSGDKKNSLVPRLRFPEFGDAGEWRQTELGNEATILKGKGIAKSDIVPDGVLPCIRYGELYTYYNEIINLVISRTNLPANNLFLSIFGDVIIPSSGETKIDIAKASCVLLNGVALGGDLNVIRSAINGSFLSYYLNGPQKYNIAEVAQGDTVVHLYSSQLNKLSLALPTSAEQQKIADCLSSLDERIAAEANKLDTLKVQKKGLMQELFPAEGEAVPRLRFPEFREAEGWKDTKLGNLTYMRAGKFVPSAEIFDEKRETLYPCYGGNGLRGFTRTHTHSGRYPLIGRQGALCGNITLVDGQFHATEHAVVASPCDKVNVDWLFYELVLLNLNRFATGQAQPGLSVEALNQVECVAPQDEEEQQKIADCLTSLDDLITAQTQKIDRLKRHKKGLMQQLFPVLDEEPA